MRECSKSIQRRLRDSRFVRHFFAGEGIDIGGKPDPLSLYKEFFPLVSSVRTWDLEDGDAQFLAGVGDGEVDFVHSSHCLEHLADPFEGLRNWFRAVKEGGWLIVIVPDEDLYEQGVFPSSYNRDHKWTFTVFKGSSWSHRSVNVLDLLRGLGEGAEVIKVEVLSESYRFDLPRFDQTLTPVGESGIEFVVRKRLSAESVRQSGYRREGKSLEREMRIHLNQYQDDMRSMKECNSVRPPFQNDGPLEGE
jgi:SAM-dependent methyltransferase